MEVISVRPSVYSLESGPKLLDRFSGSSIVVLLSITILISLVHNEPLFTCDHKRIFPCVP
jgi:hypothetical protein